MDYKNNHTLHKMKYLEIKNELETIQTGGAENQNGGSENQNSGSENIFDLNIKYPEYKKGELQKNLIKFEQKFGNEFKIKYRDNIFDVNLVKTKTMTNVTYYRMMYNTPKRRTSLLPFKIDFIDPILIKKNNNTYIPDINKTDQISGSDMVIICLEIQRILGAYSTSLRDGTEIACNKTGEIMDLSYLKLIEKGLTFYMSLGFDFNVNEKMEYKLKKEIERIIKNIRNIKTKKIIKEYENTISLVKKIIKNNDNNNFEIILAKVDQSCHDKLNVWYREPNIEYLKYLINESFDVLHVLYKYQDYKQFYTILVKLFKDDCNEYNLLHKAVISNLRYKIIYKNKIIVRDYLKDFGLLYVYRNTYEYIYTF